jgi:hypothetical protein
MDGRGDLLAHRVVLQRHHIVLHVDTWVAERRKQGVADPVFVADRRSRCRRRCVRRLRIGGRLRARHGLRGRRRGCARRRRRHGAGRPKRTSTARPPVLRCTEATLMSAVQRVVAHVGP